MTWVCTANIWAWQWFLLWRADLSGSHVLYEAWLLLVLAFFAAWKSANADIGCRVYLYLPACLMSSCFVGLPVGCIGKVAFMFQLQCCALLDHLALFVSLRDPVLHHVALNRDLCGTLACGCYIRLNTPQNVL